MSQAKLDVDIVLKNQQRLDRLEKQLGTLTNKTIGLGTVAKVAGGAIATIGAGNAVRSLVRVGSQVESLGLRFKFLFGSAEEGAKAFDTLTQFAGRVPFSLEQIAAASGNLAVVAKDSKELNNILEITGNVAAVAGLDFRTAGEQIQRAFSGGIASADIFRERGVRSLLGFKEGATVTAEETRAAFQRVFGRGGQFGQATDEFANTLDGTISMLQDKLFKFQDVASREFFEELKGSLGDLNQFFDDNADSIENFAKTVGQGLANAVQGTATVIITLRDNVDLVKAAFTALGIAVIVTQFGNLAVAIRNASTAMAILNTVIGKNPFVKIIGALAGVSSALLIFKDELFGASEAQSENNHQVEQATVFYDEYNPKIAESTRLKNIERITLSGVVGMYDDMATAQDIAANKLKYENQLLVENAINYENLKGAQKSFIDQINQFGESDIEKVNRQEAERLKRLEKLYNEDLINKNEFEDLKTKVEKEAIRERERLRKDANDKQVKEYEETLEKIRQGKIAEVDITNASEKQKREITIAQGRATLDILASQNKKFFELQKAIKIAEAIQNTYVGATKAFAQGGILGFVTGSLVIAAGLAQVAAIRSQQYPGRERGGPVSPGGTYVVGEAGPELFSPSRPGQIIPNDEMGSMGGGQAVNVTFNINTVDAQGFDNLLRSRQGTIIGVINQALNEKGRRQLV